MGNLNDYNQEEINERSRIGKENNTNFPQNNTKKILINEDKNLHYSLKKSESKLSGREMKMQITDISIKKLYLMSEQLSRLLATYLNSDNDNPWLSQSTNNLNFVNKNIIDNFEHYKIKFLPFMRDNKQFYYPTNFEIIEDSKRNFILSKFNNQYLNNLFVEIYYIPINNRSFVFMANGNHNLIYFFHIKENVGTMELFAIFECLDINRY